MAQRHINIPVFVPHLGCPNDCVFCNQKKITGCQKYDYEFATRQITEQLTTTDIHTDNVQIAFFGGSFTGIERTSMIAMLEVAAQFIKAGQVRSVRISTRPDYIDTEILNILKEYNVTDIELGIQSMDDSVLNTAERGHSAADSLRAAELIISHGFNFVGQMMVGLPDSDLDKEIMTAKEICNMGACGVRIYPTLVFQNTELENWYINGKYIPLTVTEAAYRCSKIIKVFDDHNVPIIRLGLCETDNLRTEGSVVAGPYHPAIGEISENLFYQNEIEKLIVDNGSKTQDRILSVFVSSGSISKAIGQKKSNKLYLYAKYGFALIKFYEDASLSGRNIRIAID